MKNYKVGDIVVIKTKQQLLNSGWVVSDCGSYLHNKNFNASFVIYMEKLCGQVCRIKRCFVKLDSYSKLTMEYSLENAPYRWNNGMFVEEPTIKRKLPEWF